MAFQKVLADRGYAGAPFIAYLNQRGCEADIPPHQRAKVKREYAPRAYRERHLVECCFNKRKHFRRIFSCFEKRIAPYSALSTSFVRSFGCGEGPA